MRIFFLLLIRTLINHANIIKYCKRPFESVDEMNKILIRNWNRVVSKNDTVYHLGDFGFQMGNQTIEEIFNELNGDIKLVSGNHDKKTMIDQCRFSMVYDVPIILDNYFILSHKPPQFTMDDMPWAWIYGHVHDSEIYRTITPRTACVCVERWDYTPVEFEYLKKQMERER